MILDLLVGIFIVANSFIALFIVVYAFMFLNKTKSHKDRRPWDYLFLASVIYLLYTLLLMLLELGMLLSSVDTYYLSVFSQFVYSGLILLAFISQTDLIFNNPVIIIMKKESKSTKGADEEVIVTSSPSAIEALKKETEALEKVVTSAPGKPKPAKARSKRRSGKA